MVDMLYNQIKPNILKVIHIFLVRIRIYVHKSSTTTKMYDKVKL